MSQEQEVSSGFTGPKIGSNRIEDGLDLILDHFEVPRWPRTIPTRASKGKQISVYNHIIKIQTI